MPARLQQLGLDRPGLPTLSAENAGTIARLIEPLTAPYDLTCAAWAVHNLHRSLYEFRGASSGKSNQRLADLLSMSEAATTWLHRSSEPPVILVAEEVTLWSCLVAIRPDAVDPKLLRTIGAIYFLVATGSKPPTEAVLRALLNAAMSTRLDVAQELRASQTSAALIACGSLLQKAMVQVQTRAVSRTSAATSMVEAKVEKAWAGAYRFDLRPRLEGPEAVRGLTPNDVIDIAKAIRKGAEAGSGNLLLVAVAHWHGVLPVDMAVMPIFATSPGLMRMDSTCSFTVIRLGGVLTELARIQLPGVIAADDTLQLPIPGWMSRLLRQLRIIAPTAECLAEIPGLPSNASDLRRLLDELGLPRRITAGKFVTDRAAPLISVHHDAIRISLATIDFTRVEKVAAAYEHISHSELLESLRLRAELQEWGELSVSPVPGHGYLSKVTPTLESVAELASRLLAELKACYPGPNAGIERLLIHHEAFVRYTAFILAVALVLRGQESTLLPASALKLDIMPGFNDKALPFAKTEAPELVFGACLRHHLRYVKAHYIALATRLEERASTDAPWITASAAEFRRIADGAHDRPLLLIVKHRQLQAFTHLDLVDYFGEAWTGKADAIRHAAPDLLRAAGVSHASRQAVLRHVGGAQPIVSATSAWSRSEWLNEGSRMQELLFEALKLSPYGGLIRSLPRKS